MWLMLQADKPQDYVVGTGTSFSVKEFVQASFEYKNLEWEKYVRFDAALTRPSEVDDLVGDATKAGAELGWNPRIAGTGLVPLMIDADVAAGRVKDHNAIRFTYHFLQDAMGLGTEITDDTLRGATRAMSEALSDGLHARGLINGDRAKSIKQIDDIVAVFHRLSIPALMGGRMFLGYRNMHQVLTSLGAMVGTNEVLESASRVLNTEVGEKLFQRGSRLGRFGKQAPVLGVDLSKEGIYDQIAKWSMTPYANTDTFTRLVTMEYVDRVGRRELSALNAGSINVDQFIRNTNIHRLAPSEQAILAETLKGGNTEAFLDRMSDFFERETMFNYDPTAGALLFKGLIGRLAGMFGHYPISMANHFRNMLTRGNMGDKLSFALRVAGTSAAIAAAYDRVGVRSDSFRPENALVFSGGPLYGLMNDALETMAGAPGAKPLSRLVQEGIQMTVPFGLAGAHVLKGLRAASEGQYGKALLHFWSAPVVEE
jgi:hypothetical protein